MDRIGRPLTLADEYDSVKPTVCVEQVVDVKIAGRCETPMYRRISYSPCLPPLPLLGGTAVCDAVAAADAVVADVAVMVARNAPSTPSSP